MVKGGQEWSGIVAVRGGQDWTRVDRSGQERSGVDRSGYRQFNTTVLLFTTTTFMSPML